MLRNTFRHIPKIGRVTEWKLWEAGALSWDEALEIAPEILPYKGPLAEHLYESMERLDNREAEWFARRLPAMESWRLFPEFRGRTAYIDIETDGGSAEGGGFITTIALWDGLNLRHYVHGENLRNFQDDIFDYSLIVTYNGVAFDIPFIENWFRIKIPHAHIDLRYILASLGYRGGLKGCERQLGIDRGELDGVDGYFAVLLWRDYMEGNPAALETLLAYNALDVINLERLMVEAHNKKLEETPFALLNELPLPELPDSIPFAPDMETIERIRRKLERRDDYMRNLARMMLRSE